VLPSLGIARPCSRSAAPSVSARGCGGNRRYGREVTRKSKRGKRMFAASELPSASLASRDILFQALSTGRNAAECQALRPFIRTTGGGPEAHFGPFSVSLGRLSLRQPNHGHFGTDVESSIIQVVGGRLKGAGFEKPPLRRSEQGSNYPVQRVCYSVVSAASAGLQSRHIAGVDSSPGERRVLPEALDKMIDHRAHAR
jgi:hypothetical protein